MSSSLSTARAGESSGFSIPSGVQIFSAESQGRLARQGGGTELFLESVEPELAELPLKTFFDRFPAGRLHV